MKIMLLLNLFIRNSEWGWSFLFSSSPLLPQLCDSPWSWFLPQRDFFLWGEVGEMDPTGPFALALQGCGHPCPRHRNENLLALIFLLSLTNATYTPSLLPVGRRSLKTVGRKGGCGVAGLLVSWWVQGTLSIAELPVIQPFPFWMLVLGGCCQCSDNIYHACHLTADDGCSYILVPMCSRKLLLTWTAIYANRGARQEWHPRGVWVGTVGTSPSNGGMLQPLSLLRVAGIQSTKVTDRGGYLLLISLSADNCHFSGQSALLFLVAPALPKAQLKSGLGGLSSSDLLIEYFFHVENLPFKRHFSLSHLMSSSTLDLWIHRAGLLLSALLCSLWLT